jgi:type IV pilus assembly protein PilW
MRTAKPVISRNLSQHGFTMVELMVGLALGLLTVLVISQVLALAEGKKRSVTMGSDAQVNGALSLFTLQRDVQMAGYGAVASPDALGCSVTGKYDAGGSSFTFPLAPVVITNGISTDTDAPDTITVLQGRTTNFSAPMVLKEEHPQSSNYFEVTSSFGAVVGNMMIAVPKIQGASVGCSLFSVTNDASAAATTLGPTRVPHAATAASKWNQNSIFPTGGYMSGSYLLNMGAMVYRTYSVSSANSLQMVERSPADGTLTDPPLELYPQVVNLQAMYGKDTNGDGVVDTYDNVTPTTNAGWLQVLAIRIAVVARSNQYEKDIVTASAPQWDVGANATIAGTTTCHGASKCLALKVSQIPDWQHYRFKVYDTIVPLRNVLWNS